MKPFDHTRIRNIVRAALEPLPFVHALWEAGSTAFGRNDVWSDVDLQVCVDDDRVEETFRQVEQAFGSTHPIEKTLVMPEPTWHGHAQRFYRFKGAPAWLMLDLCVLKKSNSKRFLEPEIHGQAVFLFDKTGIADSTPPLEVDVWEKRLRARVDQLRARVAMFAILVEKECRRRRSTDAVAFYNSLILAPLVELLRIRYDPWRHDFGMRYLKETLPDFEMKQLDRLIFVRNLDDLQTKYRAALRWIDSLARDLEKKSKLVTRPRESTVV